MESILALSDVLENHNHDKFFFIQVGANDGLKHDPIYPFLQKFNWRGVFVEPVEAALVQIKERYKHREGFIYENCVISNKLGMVDFYVREGRSVLSSLELGAALLRRRRHKRNCKKIQINSYTLSELVKKYNIEYFDYLQVDVEGFDDMVVFQIDKLNFLPKIINFEDQHLGQERYKKICDFLTEKNYSINKWNGSDTVCVLQKVVDNAMITPNK